MDHATPVLLEIISTLKRNNEALANEVELLSRKVASFEHIQRDQVREPVRWDAFGTIGTHKMVREGKVEQFEMRACFLHDMATPYHLPRLKDDALRRFTQHIQSLVDVTEHYDRATRATVFTFKLIVGKLT